MSYIRIRKHYLYLPFLLLGIFEFVLLSVSFLVVASIQAYLNVPLDQQVPTSLAIILAYALILSCGTLSMGVYQSMMLEGFLSMFFRTLVSYCFLGALGFSGLSLFWPYFDLGGSNLFWVVMVSTCLSLMLRRVFRGVVTSDQLSRRILVLGTGDQARDLQRDCETSQRSIAIKVVGYVGPSDQAIEPEKCLSVPDDWIKYCKEHRITEIVVAQQERRRAEGVHFPLDDLIRCKMAGIDVVNAVSFYERDLKKIKLSILKISWLVFSDGFAVSRMRDIAKRLFDLTISVVLTVALAPLLLLAALLVFFETGRPILYSQIRVGKNGKHFRIYKIRSMRQDAEVEGKAMWAQAKDSRVTKVGVFIRNTRLDELPQLWNVIRGDMSFVGPRPERPEFVETLEEQIPFYCYRHTVKPGLMGWAQLNYPYGASVEDARGKLEYDLYYTKNHSFIMDLLIMIQTVEVILLGKGVR